MGGCTNNRLPACSEVLRRHREPELPAYLELEEESEGELEEELNDKFEDEKAMLVARHSSTCFYSTNTWAREERNMW